MHDRISVSSSRSTLLEEQRLPGNDTTKPSPGRRRTYKTITVSWSWEILTWIIGSCAMVAIVCLLVHYNGQPTGKWKANFQLSTTIAALSQITQSSLLATISACIGQLKWDFLQHSRSAVGRRYRKITAADIDRIDDATRGPKGSLRLLVKIRELGLIQLGALATIFMLTFATFAQQAVKISLGTNRVDFKTATIRRAKLSTGSLHFDDHFYPLVERGNETILASQGLVPQEIVKAMYSGMIAGSNTLSDVVGHCPGDHCTWEEHKTLAVCSSLEDLSSSVYSLNPFDTDYTEMSVRELDPAPDFVNGTRSSFWTATRNASTMAYDQGEDKDHRKLAETGIADIFVGYFPPCSYNSDELWSESREDPKRWKAHRATLEYCLHTIKPTSNSSMETKIIETKKDLKWKKDEKNSRYCHTENGEDFCVRDSWQMARQLGRIFNGMGSYWSVDNGDNYYKGPWTLFLTNDILGDNVSRCDTDPSLGFAGFQRRMDNVAVAITNELRRGEATGETVRGEVFNNRQYFRMQLYWLSVPGVLYVVTTLLLFSTIFRTASQETPIWKSSALVLLRCMDRENDMNYLDEVEDKARNTAVELKYTGENWYLQNTTG